MLLPFLPERCTRQAVLFGCQSEVGNFGTKSWIDQNILGFQISMKNWGLRCMQKSQSLSYVTNYLHNDLSTSIECLIAEQIITREFEVQMWETSVSSNPSRLFCQRKGIEVITYRDPLFIYSITSMGSWPRVMTAPMTVVIPTTKKANSHNNNVSYANQCNKVLSLDVTALTRMSEPG